MFLLLLRYPYVACEIICADNGRFIETMRRNTNILSPLWSFLKNMKPRHRMSNSTINNSVTGNSPSAIQNGAIFFSRLNIFLFNKMLSTMLDFLNERVPDALDLLANNLDLQPITELIYRFYAISTTGNEEENILEWLRKGKFYEKLADQLALSKGTDIHLAVSQFINGLFSLPFPDTFPRDQVIKPFLNATWLNKLLGNIFNSADDEEIEAEFRDEVEQSSLINGLEIISSVLRASNESPSVVSNEFISCLIEHFETFFDLLKRGNGQTLQLTSGKVESFGRVRLEIVEMLCELLGCIPEVKHCEMYVEGFKNNRLIPTLLDAFFYYKQNNILHEKIVKIFQIIFEKSNSFVPLIDQLLIEYNLKQRIVDAQRENDAHVQRPRGNRLPVMGHLTLIAESLIKWESQIQGKQMTTCSFVVSDVPEESWREYTNKTFKETRLRDKKVLGGIKAPISLHEMISSSEDSGDELLNYNSVFRSGDEEQLARYFCQQIIGNLPEQFLYADATFSDESEDSEDSDDDIELVFDSRKSSRRKHHSIKSIEIPILMSQDDFDEEMFDSSFTSSLLSDSDTNSESDSENEDYEM